MKWFWESQRDGERERDRYGSRSGSPAEHDSDSRERGERAPDEHTRLLPNRVDSGIPYLSPDDPAVSPYNLWTVRLVRRITVLLAVITFLCWIVQLASAFVTLPGFHSRGGGFFGFVYVSLALVTLVISLMFFSVPSKSARILSIVMAVLLLAQTIIILAVEKTRHEEAWVGVASVVWVLLISIWDLVAGSIVQRGKTEEEERLTGRSESRRTLLEWTGVTLSTVALFAMTLVLVLMSCNLIIRAVDAGLAPPGGLYWVDDDKYQIHVYCRGNETNSDGEKVPTVLFEAGEDPVEWGLWQFADNALQNGSISRYCFADRSGVAWVRRHSPIPTRRRNQFLLTNGPMTERCGSITSIGKHGERCSGRGTCAGR